MDIKWENDIFTAALEGRIDSGNSGDVETEIRGAIGDRKPASVVLDAGGLEYISSAGLRVILKAQKAMAAKGGMKLLNVNETIMEIFEITGFSDILVIE